MLECNRKELKEHIKNNLKENMTLDNFGDWEMDHKIPIQA